MFIPSHPLILASASPRRKDFLAQLGLTFHVVPATIDETPFPGEVPRDFALRMATGKARQVAATHPDACVIGADTVVTLGTTIFGKPGDPAHALDILRNLRGQTHQVITGCAVVVPARNIEESITAITAVTFDHFADDVLQAYVDSGDPMDKAGAYGIQGSGAFLVRSIVGSCSNVVGLPVNAVIQLLLRHRLLQTKQAPDS